MSISFRVLDDSPQTALVSFPQGIPWNLEEMTVSIREKPSKKKRKRAVIGSLNGVEYIGNNFNEGESYKSDVSRYAIGLLDEQSGKMEVVPIDHPYVLRPQLHVASSGRETSIMSNYDRKLSLTESFGSKKKQRAQRAAASNIIKTENISGVNAIESVMAHLGDSTVANGTATTLDAAEAAVEQHRLQMLPEYDITAASPELCYPISSLLPAFIMDNVGQMYDSLTESYTGEDLAVFWRNELSLHEAPNLVSESCTCIPRPCASLPTSLLLFFSPHT